MDDLQFLKHKGAFDLPPRRILDECVSVYFHVFHAFFPVIDRADFLESYRKCDQETLKDGKGPSMLLLQALVFTASAVCPHCSNSSIESEQLHRPLHQQRQGGRERASLM